MKAAVYSSYTRRSGYITVFKMSVELFAVLVSIGPFVAGSREVASKLDMNVVVW